MDRRSTAFCSGIFKFPSALLPMFALGVLAGCLPAIKINGPTRDPGLAAGTNNHAPVAVAQTLSVDANAALAMTLSATDEDADTLAYSISSGGVDITHTVHGTLSGTAPNITYTPNADYVGIDSFTFKVNDGTIDSDPVTVSITVAAVHNDAPVANALSPAAFNEDTQSIITLSYTDADLDSATTCALSALSHITTTQACACAAGVCTVGVTGTANYNGAASFNYTVTANGEASNSAAASLTITGVDDAPVAAAISPVAFNEDAQSIITLSYTDVESNLATVCALSNLSHVTATQACACAAGVCTIGVTGTANYNGAATFNYTVTANGQTSNSALATLSITAVNDAPVAAVQAVSATQNTDLSVTMSATDAEGTSLSYAIVTGPSNGALGVVSGAAVTYTPTADYAGPDSFTFRANDGNSNSNTATVSVTVHGWYKISSLSTQFWGDICPNNGLSVSADGSKIAACGNDLYLSNDSGVTWSGSRGDCHCAAYSGDGTKLVKTIGANIYYSATDGATWTTSGGITMNGSSLFGLSMSSNGSKIAITDSLNVDNSYSGSMYLSTNGGATFTTVMDNWSDYFLPWYTADGSAVFAILGDGYSPSKSIDDGLNWSGLGSSFTGFSYPISGYGTADGSKLYYNWGNPISVLDTSMDTYVDISNPTAGNYYTNNFAISGDGNVIIRDWHYKIYKSTNAGATWIEQSTPGQHQANGWLSMSTSFDGSVSTVSDSGGYLWVFR